MCEYKNLILNTKNSELGIFPSFSTITPSCKGEPSSRWFVGLGKCLRTVVLEPSKTPEPRSTEATKPTARVCCGERSPSVTSLAGAGVSSHQTFSLYLLGSCHVTLWPIWSRDDLVLLLGKVWPEARTSRLCGHVLVSVCQTRTVISQ